MNRGRITAAEIGRIFARYDPVALGAAIGAVAALLVFGATAALLLKGGEVVGPRLALLSHYLISFDVSWTGGVIGAVEAGVLGFVFGWILAAMINLVVALHESAFWFNADVTRTHD